MGFLRVQAGIEYKTMLVICAQQHQPGGYLARRRHGGQAHGVRLWQIMLLGFLIPVGEQRQGIILPVGWRGGLGHHELEGQKNGRFGSLKAPKRPFQLRFSVIGLLSGWPVVRPNHLPTAAVSTVIVIITTAVAIAAAAAAPIATATAAATATIAAATAIFTGARFVDA